MPPAPGRKPSDSHWRRRRRRRVLELGLVICNAGTSWKGAFLDHDPADQRRMIEVNCQAPVAVTRALGPLHPMVARSAA